ncbi:MAG: hypothetical protein ACD_3C00049G0005 [uncultured bacterium (gcode 4)]|uniref:Uncharacterized protein n=1 Tax=uncultured bacterium (gcode 4) TaxID=1234023 RepID=K2FZZ6_9BACT|nr:MAG: hypothetical protein ACD_3C00049G0005 [uncultured bacterium (gcode 4)]
MARISALKKSLSWGLDCKILKVKESVRDLVDNGSKMYSANEKDDPEMISFGIENTSLKKYIRRVSSANSQDNTAAVPISSDKWEDMMVMLQECSDLIRCFSGSRLDFSIDWAIWLSLRQLNETGSFLRKHRDIDLLVREGDLNDIDNLLRNQSKWKKWWLFIWHTKEAKTNNKLSFSPFKQSSWDQKWMIQAIPVTDDWIIDEKRYSGFTMIDIHYLKNKWNELCYGWRNINEDEIFKNEFVHLPDWTKSPVVSLIHMAVNKAKSDRAQDIFDLKYILSLMESEEQNKVIDELTILKKTTDREDEIAKLEQWMGRVLEYRKIWIINNLSEKLKNNQFKKRFNPLKYYSWEEINKKDIEKKIDLIIDSKLNFSKFEALKLIEQSIEYYSIEEGLKSVAKYPAYHSTNSFTLRKALEEWFEWWHGAYNWEHQVLDEQQKAHEQKKLDYDPQVSLSVSINPDDLEYVEYFQQLYARVNCRKWRLKSILSVDSKEFGLDNTLTAMDKIFAYEISDAAERLRRDVSKRLKKENVTDEEIMKFKNDMLEAVDNRAYAPNIDHDDVKDYLKKITSDHALSKDINEELNDPFPCFITFEGDENRDGFSRLFWAYDKEISSVPCEDRFKWNLSPECIREIRVPLTQISKIREWLADKWLSEIKVIPIELFEIKRILCE